MILKLLGGVPRVEHERVIHQWNFDLKSRGEEISRLKNLVNSSNWSVKVLRDENGRLRVELDRLATSLNGVELALAASRECEA